MKPLSDVELSCIQANIMHGQSKAAVDWLKVNGHKMNLRNYQRHLKCINENGTARLYEEAKGARAGQMRIIDELETVKKQFWKLYNDKDTETPEKIRALREIREVIPHITAAKAAIPHIIQDVIKNFGRQDRATKPGNSRQSAITAE